jgi:Bacterial sugar transferase
VYRSLKRLFDLAVTVPALLLLSLVMALMALLVRLNLGSPVLFRHQRPGIGGRPFILLKFRTMVKLTPVQLQLSGHSHGGQVRIPALGPLILPRWGRIYRTGLYELNGRFVYTGRGLGMVGLPLRFDCPPELTEITLETA